MKSLVLVIKGKLLPSQILAYNLADFCGRKGRTKKFKIIFQSHGLISITLGSPKNLRKYFLRAFVVGAEGEPS